MDVWLCAVPVLPLVVIPMLLPRQLVPLSRTWGWLSGKADLWFGGGHAAC